MDFFEQQELARKKTRVLVLYFSLAVILTMLAVYAVALVGTLYFNQAGTYGRFESTPDPLSTLFSNPSAWWDPQLALIVFFGVGLVVFTGSSVRIYQLARGGGSVASELGGRPVNRQTSDPDEKKLLNVVEEMSIASGTPMPETYVLDEEPGINAFAAGYKSADTAIGVTRGCIRRLSRDELQGTIAHEFSHILNGDMRMNMRLSCLTFGILFIALTGKQIIQLPFRVRFSGSSRGRGGAGPVILVLLASGLALCIIGSIGYFFTRLIQAAVCRQREFLADAAAVQFTRNPDGIANALKKIAGLAEGSSIKSPQASKASHFFFGNAHNSFWDNIFATHPPVVERIRAIEPDFSPDSLAPLPSEESAAIQPAISDLGLNAALGLSALSNTPASGFIQYAGAPDPGHLELARGILDSIPAELQQACRDPLEAKAVIFSLLLSDNAASAESQMALLQNSPEAPVCLEISRLEKSLASLQTNHQLSLVDLATPALRQMSAGQYDSFTGMLTRLAEADGQISLFEYTLQKMLRYHLDAHFHPSPPPKIRYQSLLPVLDAAVTLLGALARVKDGGEDEMLAAFNKGTSQLNVTGQNFTLPPPESCALSAVDAALNQIVLAAPLIRRNILYACASTVMTDQQINLEEGELLRAISASLGCPIPPFASEKL
ncbi:MAG: M48 family metallopeptidase [Methylacidiphilales bacterium]|nr:M48 family metallopeptidase [Candidatus Methylacidiphilales bacterium]